MNINAELKTDIYGYKAGTKLRIIAIIPDDRFGEHSTAVCALPEGDLEEFSIRHLRLI